MVETRSMNRKRQMLIMQSNQISSWTDLSGTFESLNNDTLTTVLEFVGPKSYKSFGGLNKQCREVYLSSGMTKETFLFGYGSLAAIKDEAKFISELKIETEKVFHYKLFYSLGKGVVYHNRRDAFEWALQERKYDVLNGICQIAAGEGRIHLLDEVLNKVKDWDGDGSENKWDVFKNVDECAARFGKLSVLKWYHTKGLVFNEDVCAWIAAENGHIDIIQWLKENKGLDLDGYMYNYAIDGGQLHVLKWLREQEFPWDLDTFPIAAHGGNLETLQWLHDEGCPWPENYGENCIPVREERLKPGVLDWLRVNDYEDRIILEDNDDY